MANLPTRPENELRRVRYKMAKHAGYTVSWARALRDWTEPKFKKWIYKGVMEVCENGCEYRKRRGLEKTSRDNT